MLKEFGLWLFTIWILYVSFSSSSMGSSSSSKGSHNTNTGKTSGAASHNVTVRIIDGDTLKYGDKRLRLCYIDAPELKQPYGQEAKLHLISLMSSPQVPSQVSPEVSPEAPPEGSPEVSPDLIYEEHGKEKYGRTLVAIFRGTACLNEQMVKDGYAWAYGKKYRQQEAEARLNHLGLWAYPEPIEPKAFRHHKK